MDKIDTIIFITGIICTIIVLIVYGGTKKINSKEFNYKGHSYIYFKDMRVVHNPDCKMYINF